MFQSHIRQKGEKMYQINDDIPLGCIYESQDGSTKYCPMLNHDDVPYCQWFEDNQEAAIGIDERPVYCPILPSAQSEQSIAQERYVDLCEYFKDCSDQGRSILNDRKEFKSWLDRMKWHVMECDKLGRELEKLKSAQPETHDKRTETHACDCVSRQDAIGTVKHMREVCDTDDINDYYDLILEAFNVLPFAQPESCEDAVSRADVEHEIANILRGIFVEYQDIAKKTASKLPSVTPKRKTGKWNFIGDQMFECTECGTCYTQNQFHQMMVRITDPEFPNFCPNCGADMGGKQDG